MHHLRAGASHLQQLVIRNLIELFCVSDQARIAREDSIDIGKDLAGIGIERARQSDSGEIGPAATKRRGIAFGILALKSGHDYDVIVIE